MKKFTLSIVLVVAIILQSVGFISFAVEKDSTLEENIAINSDVESYENGWYYYIDFNKGNCVYRETVDFKNKTYYTNYAVNQIAVVDGKLYLSVDNKIKTINLTSAEENNLLTAENKIERFSKVGNNIFYLSNGSIFEYNMKLSEKTYVTGNNEVDDFWVNENNTLSYMIDDNTIYTLNLITNELRQEKNNLSVLNDEIPSQGTLEESYGGAMTVSSLKTKFPAGKYWNHAGNPGNTSAVNNQNGYTSTPCPKHGNCGTSSQTCNGFAPNGTQLAWQCMGYAEKCGYDVTGYNPRNNANGWNTVSNSSALNTLKAGDIVRYKNDGHSIYVTGVSGNTVTYTDCNSDGHCIIRWNATISKSTLKSTFTNVRVSPSVDVGTTTSLTVDSRYSKFMPLTAYLCGWSTVYPCESDCATMTGGEIWTTDECTINEVYTNGWCKVTYPAGSSTKIAYTQTLEFIYGTTLTQKTAPKGMNAYSRADCATIIGSVDSGDVCYVVASYDNMYEVIYPTASGYKMGWTKTSDWNYTAPTADNRYNPYCPIKGYILSADTRQSTYESDKSTYAGQLFVDDYCTINAVYSDGWCQVTYPVGTSTKTQYVPLNAFVHNTSYNPVSYNATAQINVYTKSNMATSPNWWVSAGDKFFVIGESGSLAQVLYPIDAQYGGGYKLGWIYKSDIPKVTYAVSYNANGGSGAPSSQTKTYNVSLTLSSTIPTKSGYTFAGWSTSSSATTVNYVAGATYTDNAAVTLYAVWTPNKYTIMYNLNGGSGSIPNQTKTHGVNLTLSSDSPHKVYKISYNSNGGTVNYSLVDVYCEFLGWSTSSTATKATYAPGASFSMNQNTTLYAVWSNPVINELQDCTRDGYIFDGWYTALSGGTKVDETTVVTSNMTLYAHWTLVSLSSVAVKSNPTKTSYYVGDTLNTAGLTLTATYNNGTTETISNGFTCTPTTLSTVGTQKITVSYGGKTTSFNVTVNSVVLSNVAVKTAPTKTSYYVGDTLNTAGFALTATYNNGTTKTITSGFTCTPTALNTAGTQKITVTYGGKTTYFNVTVTDNTPSENDPQFAVSNSKASKGNTVDVTVSVKNNPGIIAAKLNISYDTSKLKLTKVTNGAVMGSSLFDPGNDLTASPYSVCWNDMDSNHSGDGVMVTFTFEIAENAEIGVVPVTLTYDTGSTFNSDLENVSFATVSGSVEITDRTPGDTNGDNEIDLKDVVLIRRYLSGGWNVTINESNADVNQDGYVDLKDVVIIRRYLSGGWNVTLK